jgi:hypothetical protein
VITSTPTSLRHRPKWCTGPSNPAFVLYSLLVEEAVMVEEFTAVGVVMADSD